MFILNSESVYIGYSLEELEQVKDVLLSAGIQYKQKVVNYSAGWGRTGSKRGAFGSLGINMDHEKQYTVWVKNKDYNRAKGLIDKEIRYKEA